VKNLPARLLLPLLLVLTGLLTQCQRPEEAQPPQPLLPKDKMVSLLVAMHLTEARVEGANLPPDSARALYQRLHKDILWRRDISDSLFHQSYRYYSVHEKDLDEIYGIVIDSLTARQQLINNPAAARQPELSTWK
jgi:hypothetical protein